MSKTYRTLWYHAKLGDGKWQDDIISIYTTAVNVVGLCLMLKFKLAAKAIKYRYSHCEKWKPDEDGNFEMQINESLPDGGEPYIEYLGTCQTSTLRDGAKGTVSRPAADVLKHPERWHHTEHTVEDDDYEDAVEWGNMQVANNLGYNKASIGGFINPFRKTVIAENEEMYDNKQIPHRKNICSVFCQGFDWQAGLFSKWVIWSPLKYFLKGDVEPKPLVKE